MFTVKEIGGMQVGFMANCPIMKSTEQISNKSGLECLLSTYNDRVGFTAAHLSSSLHEAAFQ